MRPLTLRRSSLRDRRWAASLAAGLIAATFSGPALASCPWIVQPSDVITGDLPDYEIMFNGRPDPNLTYYAFTVTDADLAWELSSGNGLNAVDGRTRPLAVIESTDRDRFRADPSSVMPLTVYLVVATASIPKLDAIAASFEPSRPIAVGLRMRGASDTSGPLPHRSLPGVELHYASHDPSGTQIGSGSTEYQLCAYQVLIR